MRTSRIARLAFPFLATSLLAVVPACDEDPELDANFTKASQADRQRAVGVASGATFATAAILTTALIPSGLESGCPKVTVKSDSVKLQGGCSFEGVRVEGSATLEGDNLDEESDSGSLSMRWNDFRIVEDGKTLRIDGSVDVDGSETRSVVRADLTVEIGGLSSTLDGEMTCTATGCKPSDDSYVTLSGVGTAQLKGSWQETEDSLTGTLELAGADTMKVDFGKEQPAGCYATTIDGASVAAVCVEIDDEIEDGDESLRGFSQALSVLR
jgi:hypothetical protein